MYVCMYVCMYVYYGMLCYVVMLREGRGGERGKGKGEEGREEKKKKKKFGKRGLLLLLLLRRFYDRMIELYI